MDSTKLVHARLNERSCEELIAPRKEAQVISREAESLDQRSRILIAIGIALVSVCAPATWADAKTLEAASLACQECHGIADWEINDPVAKRTVYLSVATDAYLQSSHGSLGCRACHDRGYDGPPPHFGPRGTPLYQCVSCHEKDSAVRWLDFPARKSDLLKSAHAKTNQGRLDCHTCHDPHTFRPINDSKDALHRIARSNAICLDCHSAGLARHARFDQSDVSSAHAGFPNYENHLRKVKCVACHTADPNSTHHDITSKDQAVRECVKCHAPTSSLLDIVYGPQRAEQTNSLAEDAYVIGAARSPALERLSIVAFLALVGLIALHSLVRIVHSLRRKSSNGQ